MQKRAGKPRASSRRPKRKPGRHTKPRAPSERPSSAPANGLTPKQERFVEEYLVDLNATQAAIRAGYSEDTARQMGSENLSKPDIQTAVAKRMRDRAVRTRVTQDRVLTMIADRAEFDPIHVFNLDGSVKDIHDIPPHIRSSIVGIEVEEIKLGADGPVVGRIKKLKISDPDRPKEMLGRHLKLFTDKVEHSGGMTLEQILAKSWEREGQGAGASK